ncbi:hypothetical protein Sste5346_004368 [Sporothrix stenoceras]|uniref:Uncharacterized protein n=1 Tax=Sporothrix stenoceras TaxID=5173 RepID=A0ABR3Z7U2_9PEZI
MAVSPGGTSVAAGPASSGPNSASRPQARAEPSQPPQPPHNLEVEPDKHTPQSPSHASSPKYELRPASSPAAPSALPFGIEKAQSSTPLPHEESILAIFSDALKSKEDDSDIELVSTAAAIALNMLCPSIDDKSDKNDKDNDTVVTVEAFLWSLWTLLLGIVRIVPHDTQHPGQATLVGILDALRDLPRGTVSVWGNSDMQLWRDLPLFVPRFTESNARPRGDNVSDEAIQHWRNQSAFAARCLQAGLATWYDEAVYALRDALEDDDEGDIAVNVNRVDPPEKNAGGDNGKYQDDQNDQNAQKLLKDGNNKEKDKKDDKNEEGEKGENDKDGNNVCSALTQQQCAILAATEWVIHSGKILLKQAQESDEDYEDYEDYEDIDGGNTAYGRDDDVPLGPLFREREPDARAGLSGARWEFWKERFQELLQPAPDHDLPEDVQAAVRSAVECMKRAEKETAEEAEEQIRKWETEMDAQEKEDGDGEGKDSI